MADGKVITVMCATRLPELLVTRIDAAAKSGGVSRAQFIAEACRKYLDRDSSAVEQRGAIVTKAAGSIPAPIPPAKMNNAMAEFLSKLPNSVVTPEPDPIQDSPQRSCTECDRTMASKFVKGRGMVYACSDIGCPMYGLERK
jgi:hypothetical protein